MNSTHLDDALFGQHEPTPSVPTRPPRRGGGARFGRLLVVLLALAMIGGVGYGGYLVVKPLAAKITGGGQDYPGPGSGSAQVVVNDGDSGAVIGRALVTAGVVKSVEAFTKASSANPDLATGVQPGTYTLLQQMTAKGALEALNDPANRYIGPKVTIREGLWKSEVFAALSKGTGVPLADYEAAAKDPAALGLPEQAGGNVEGYLFPATYTFKEGTSAAEQLKAMVSKARQELTKAGISGADMEQVVILASVIEAEARLDQDRPKVARVFLNRIDTPGAPTYGLLQSDATVSYGVQRRAVIPTNAEKANDNPYNTFLHPGLPAGPIGNPGLASLEAAAHPADGPWFFFVTVNPLTGETKFAETLDEHNRNVAEFQQFCKDNPDVCKS